MENYGFIILSDEESANINFSKGTEMFEELYNKMIEESNQDKKLKVNYKNVEFMDDNEKQYHFSIDILFLRK